MSSSLFRFIDLDYSHTFIFELDYVDVITYKTNSDVPVAAWVHKITNNQIVWRQDDIMELSQEAKDYANRIIKLKVFA